MIPIIKSRQRREQLSGILELVVLMSAERSLLMPLFLFLVLVRSKIFKKGVDQ